jgi:hypothetical protein
MKNPASSQEEAKDAENTPHKPGWRERLHAKTPKFILDNAPRIVGFLKIVGAFAMTRDFGGDKGVSGARKGFFAAGGYGFITANVMLLLFGGRKSTQKKQMMEAVDKRIKQKSPVAAHLSKVLRPHLYPYESAATISSISSVLWTTGGMIDKDRSWGRALAGLMSLGSDMNAAFTKEKIGEAYKNPHKKGTFSHFWHELKTKPVLVSSLLNIGSDVSSMVEGVRHKVKKGSFNNDFYAGLFLFLGNLFQGLFVNKNEYSLEKTGDELAKDTTKNHPNEKPVTPEKEPEASPIIKETVPPFAKNWSQNVRAQTTPRYNMAV